MSRTTQQSQKPADVPESLCRLSLKNPIIFSSVAWAAASAGYAMWQVPEAPLTSPELLQEQLQIRIRNIPVPTSSPRYQQFKEYYMREHDIQLQEYKVLAKQHSNSASFNWRAMLHGFGVGSMLLAAGLAVLEYHCGLISYWMEVAEDSWCDCQQRRALQRAKTRELADNRKVERLLQEIGEEEGPTGKAAPKRRPTCEVAAVRRSKPLEAAAGFPPSQPLPVKEAVKAGDAPKEVESKNPTLLPKPQNANAAANAALREQIRSKVIERHLEIGAQAQVAAPQESAAEEKKEAKQAEVEEVKKTPKRKGKKDAEAKKKKEATSEEVPAAVPTGVKKEPKKERPDPDVEAALQKLAKTAPLPTDRHGPELLREAQELLSRLEAEDFLRELETEEERAKRAAGKKKAKKARAKAKDKKLDQPVEKIPVPAQVEVAPCQASPEAESSESEAEVEEKIMEDKNSNPSSVEDSTEIQSLDDDHRSSSEAPSESPAEPNLSEANPGWIDPGRRAVWADVKDETWISASKPREQVREEREEREAKRPVPSKVAVAPTPTALPSKSRPQARQTAPCRKKPAREAPWSKAKVEEAPRQRPCNYAEAACGHRIPAEVQELMSSMGIAGSRDDLIAFLNANSSREWRNQKGDLSSYSMKDLGGFAGELLKRLSEQPSEDAACGEANGFDGAVAGAQILEWVRGGKKDCKDSDTTKSNGEAQSHLRAEAPEFVPAADTSTEVGQTIMTVAVPAELPPGCQIVMVPVQLGQIPQNMVFEEQMPSDQIPMAIVPGPPYGGMQMMAMPCDTCELPVEPAGDRESSSVNPAPDNEEHSPKYCGYNTDDECESIFGDAAEIKLRRQKTF